MYHMGEGTRPCPFPVTGNGHGRVPSITRYMIKVIGAHVDGPIRIGMTLLTTSVIVELIEFYGRSLRDHAQNTTTKLVAFGLGNPSVSVPRNGERTRPGSLAHVIHDRSYWNSCWWTNQKRDDVIDNQ